MIYSPEITLREARTEYFRLNNFAEDGGYNERWIKVKVWRIPVWLPNTKGRRAAVKLHDLHHVLTEYPTTWRGEAEISAWEVGSGGLRHYYAGWVLDLMNIAQGLVVNPRGVYHGYMRGRSSRNLYSNAFDEELLNNKVGDYRHWLLLDRPAEKPGIVDLATFLFWVGISIVTYLAAVSLPLAPLVALGLLIWWW